MTSTLRSFARNASFIARNISLTGNTFALTRAMRASRLFLPRNSKKKKKGKGRNRFARAYPASIQFPVGCCRFSFRSFATAGRNSWTGREFEGNGFEFLPHFAHAADSARHAKWSRHRDRIDLAPQTIFSPPLFIRRYLEKL